MQKEHKKQTSDFHSSNIVMEVMRGFLDLFIFF